MNARRHIHVWLDLQSLEVCDASGLCLMRCPVSTSARGAGFEPGSLKTPTGKFRIHAKIGADQPCGTIFVGRQPVGHWSPETPSSDAEDLILTRILQLDGLEPENANTLSRYIYIHGTNQEDLIGTPASHGCVRLRNDDMIRLFDLVVTDDFVTIHHASGA